MKLWEIKWHGGGGSGQYIRIVAAVTLAEGLKLVFGDNLIDCRMAKSKELVMPVNPAILAEYDFENEDYEG